MITLFAHPRLAKRLFSCASLSQRVAVASKHSASNPSRSIVLLTRYGSIPKLSSGSGASHRSWLEKRREWVSDAQSKKVPGGEPSLAFNHERESGLGFPCPNSSDRNPKLGSYCPEFRCGPTLGGPLIPCGEGVGETSGDSIAINWLTVTKR
jgi:hypothetical protein